MTMMTSPPSASDTPASVFQQLHPKVQRWIWEQGWAELRSAQVKAIPPVLAGELDVIISAATAAGKTEAAFLPIVSTLLEFPSESSGVEVLYVSPLKALINDQHGRLEQFAGLMDITVNRWHGDVGGAKKSKLLKDPSGILLITPESLEALFVTRGTGVGSLLGALRYVVVDELHAFIGTERGAQLQSLLHRVELTIRRRVPRVAMSATLGDLRLAAEFLRPGDGERATVIEGDDDGQEIRLQLRGFVNSPPKLDNRAALAADAAGEELTAEDLSYGDQVAIAEHLFKVLRGKDNLVFANKRRDVEIYADLLATKSNKDMLPNEFFPHHGSLSKELREHVEARLKGAEQPITAVCTSTLEMGIDIGDVESVAQIGAPPSVASLRQRLGRSGRRGDAAVLRMYISEVEITDKTPPADQVRAELVQSIAMVQLLLRGWIERPSVDDLHLSTLIQQLLSLIAQHGGVRPPEAFGALCGHGPFQRVTEAMFADLLRALGTSEVLTQDSEGTLLLDVAGERLVNHYSFYAAFNSPEEYRLVAAGRQLGTIPVDYPLLPGALLIFAGRRWRVLNVDDRHKVIDLERSPAGRPPEFGGAVGRVDDQVRKEMLDIYRSEGVPSFLDARARDLLAEGRDNFARLGLNDSCVVYTGSDTVIFPWVGDRIVSTIAAVLTAGGLSVGNDGIAVTVVGLSPDQLRVELEVLVPGGAPDPVELAEAVENKLVEKHDCLLSPDLLNVAFAARSLDPLGAWQALERTLESLRSLAD